LVNLSGRGDKDMHTVAQATGSEGWFEATHELT
jgi:tryptophan synthase beta subunit